jgi:ADP-ribose pyrophosphatase YjhB (NUDIX family)
MPHDTACTDPACGCGHAHGTDHGPRPPVAEAPAPWRPADRVRVLALGVFRREDQILCAPVHSDDGTILGWRPLGGAVAFGERAADALAREIREETGQEIADIRPLGVLENLFTHEGAAGHEVIFVFDARFTRPEIYAADALAFTEAGHAGEAKWIALAKARAGRIRLYPEGLAGLLPE